MRAASTVRRSWKSFIGGQPSPGLSRRGARGRDAYTLRQRVWASFIGVDLPVRFSPSPTQAPAVNARLVPRESGGRRQTGRLYPGWFELPPLPSAGVLTAAGSDAVALEASSPDGLVAVLVRSHGPERSEYSLELVLRGVDAARPLVSEISYTQADGHQRLLLVPVVQGPFGLPASYVRLPGFSTGRAWRVAVPSPVAPDSTWDATTVADSVRAALNESTRSAWRQVRELLESELRDVVDGALS